MRMINYRPVGIIFSTGQKYNTDGTIILKNNQTCICCSVELEELHFFVQNIAQQLVGQTAGT